ncbi:hypothetical protein RF11_04404 [Thelohanellus kitauei]|uniref:Uncharacterized protein n=1 Tax=Thelohanellus kitauei TaxID=669202 RepID=A0A0C2IVJ1_THEKT|nr:hypothetical protein RF11_04404 [Thelohanellus kitauei]
MNVSLNSETRQCIINFQGLKKYEWSLIKCNIKDSTNEVLFGGCTISFPTRDDDSIKTYVINYLQVFRKDTNYNFTNPYINFKIGNLPNQKINFLITELVITFPNATLDCIFQARNSITAKLNFYQEIYHCKSDYPLYTTENQNIYDLSTNGSTDEIRQQSMKKKGLFPANNIVVIFFAFVTIATCIAIIGYKKNAYTTFEPVYQIESEDSYCYT